MYHGPHAAAINYIAKPHRISVSFRVVRVFRGQGSGNHGIHGLHRKTPKGIELDR